jgi:hypothetical protein
MVYVALVIALIAGLIAWQANRRNKDLEERIARVNSRVYQIRQEMLETQEKAQREIMALRFELMRSTGELKVTADMTLDEVNMLHPQVPQLLAGFHIGGCSSCSYDGSQRLDLVAASGGQPVEPILVALTQLLEADQNGSLNPAPLKMPNVQLVI